MGMGQRAGAVLQQRVSTFCSIIDDARLNSLLDACPSPGQLALTTGLRHTVLAWVCRPNAAPTHNAEDYRLDRLLGASRMAHTTTRPPPPPGS
jgi:hypothetical protein